jgi:chromosomal replication initiator protein
VGVVLSTFSSLEGPSLDARLPHLPQASALSLAAPLQSSSPASEAESARPFERSSLDAYPELVSAFDRYLAQARYEVQSSVLKVYAPTAFHLMGLRRLEAKLLECFRRQQPIRELHLEVMKAASAGGVAVRAPSPQISLPLSHAARRDLSEDLERKNRLSPPEAILSPSFDHPYELAKRWTQAVNSNLAAQVLWVHGGPGTGKTHLLKQLHRWVDCKKKLVATDVMSFFYEWRRALEAKDHLNFVQKYRRETDVLILENLENLGGKEKTQEEILFTVSALLDRGCCVAVSSSKNPIEFQGVLEPALYSRLVSGLTVGLTAPDKLFKERLWRHLLKELALTDCPIDVLAQDRLFGIPVQSARATHSLFINALNRMSLKRELSMEDLVALELHFGSRTMGPQGRNSPIEIVDKVAQLCGLTRSAMLGNSRRANVSQARRFVCLALARFCGLTNSAIACQIEKDPSTVSHCMKALEDDLLSQRSVREQWNWICTQLGFSHAIVALGETRADA